MNNLNVSKCMRDEKLMYIIIGFILGVIACILVERIVRRPVDSNGNPVPRTNLFPSASPNNVKEAFYGAHDAPGYNNNNNKNNNSNNNNNNNNSNNYVPG